MTEEKEEEEDPKPSPPTSSTISFSPTNPQISLAIYIAMAHAGLALTLALLYGLTRLLEDYWRPIQWAILCSMPLRQLQTSLVSFSSHTLRLGLLETLLALPIALLRATSASVIDSHTALLRFLRRPRPSSPSPLGFSKLMQWLVSFAFFVLLYEYIGLASLPVFALPSFVAYATGFSAPPPPGVAKTLSAISFARHGSRLKFRRSSISSRISRYLTRFVRERLNSVVGIGLIVVMIVGSVSGLLFFSYKIGIEAKDAVISLKTHLEENDYAERIGLKQWIDENDVPELIDTYTTKFYETVLQQIDSLAKQYNATEIVEGLRYYLVRTPSETVSFSSVASEQLIHRPFSVKLQRVQLRIRNGEWRGIFGEFDNVFREFKALMAREDLVEKIRGFALQSVDVSKRVVASSTMVLAGSANLMVSVALSIVSGAAGLLNFISQLMVFFWLLYYLITSDSGGVMDHVLGMLPVSKSTRDRCAEVLDHAVSSVLLATAKVALFQGCLTYLLFRFYRIHFLYMSTFLALMSAVLPITPTWLSSIPAAAQLAMEARYIEAVLLTVIHLLLIDYGTTSIQDAIPGQSSYLTGLSILGGMALFPSILEGAIMGPLLMTVMIALKNLYAEFVLASAKGTGR